MHFFCKQQYDEAGKMGVQLQKLLLVLLFLFVFEHVLGIISVVKIQPGEKQSEISSGQLQYETTMNQQPMDQFAGELLSFMFFLPIFLIGFIGSYKRNKVALLVYIILNIIWLVFLIVVLALLILIVFLFIGYIFQNASHSQNFDIPNHDLAPSNLRALSLHIRNNDPMTISPSNNWVALICGIASLASSLISLALWILSIYFAVKQRNLLTQMEMPQFVIHAPHGVPAYDPTIQIQYVQPVNSEFGQFPQQYQQAQFAPVPQPFGVKE